MVFISKRSEITAEKYTLHDLEIVRRIFNLVFTFPLEDNDAIILSSEHFDFWIGSDKIGKSEQIGFKEN